MIKSLILLSRPQQYVKNTFLFLPLFFSGGLFVIDQFIDTLLGFIFFSLITSAIYCFNDIIDIEKDKIHPIKKYRPLASGKISKITAIIYSILLLIISFSLSLTYLNINFSIILFSYVILNVFYSFYLKNIAIIDVFIIAVGFSLRVFAGGFCAELSISNWIIMMTFLLTLLLAIGKRKDDVILYTNTGVKPRSNTDRYSIEFIDLSICFLSSIVVVCYIMYTMSVDVISRFNSQSLYITSMFVLSGILRYLQVSIIDKKSSDPTNILLHDKFIQLCVILWLISFLVIIYA